jgi:hypothetical protein
MEGRVKLLKAGPDVGGTDSMEGRVKLMKAGPDVKGTDRVWKGGLSYLKQGRM